LKLGLLVSGNLGLELLIFLKNKFQVEFVMTDNKSTEIHHFCGTNNLSIYTGNPRTELARNFYQNFEIDILVSINYLYIIEAHLINLPKLLAFNVHGSLLPKYRGRTPHVWAIINNETETGITAHIINEGCDTGNVLQQIKISILPEETGYDLLQKFQKNYFIIVSNVLNQIKNNQILSLPQDNSKATFFVKRVPEDGRIDWNWQKERIKNWIRAQAFPYPGAFTFLENYKIIIDEIEFVDSSFDCTMPNGLILSVSPVMVKTPNGVVKFKSIRTSSDKIELGKIFK
jgi:methionyl-tRNA formyltransferase